MHELNLLFGCAVFILLLVICSKKFGRDKVLSVAIKVMSPIFIILFYLSGLSIIIPIVTKLHISNSIVVTSDSVRVAIDSAIVTLFINTILVLLNSPIKVEVESKNRQDLKQVITYCSRQVRVDYSVKVNFRYKWIKKVYQRYWTPCLHIVNSKNTSIAVDKAEEYLDIISCDNVSKYISIDLTNISNSDMIADKLYFTLDIQSDRTIKWDDVIYTELFINQKKIRGLHKLFWQAKENILNLVHREEEI